jgi:hypothetical protein
MKNLDTMFTRSQQPDTTIGELIETLRKYPQNLKIDLAGSDYGPTIWMYFDGDQQPTIARLMDEEHGWASPEEVITRYNGETE